MKSLKEKLVLVDRAFAALDCLNNISWADHRDVLLGLTLDEEKQHRTGNFAQYHPDAVSARTAARLMAVFCVAGYLTDKKVPTIKDYISMKKSFFYAASLVANYRDEIIAAWEKLPVAELAALDYCEFVKAE